MPALNLGWFDALIFISSPVRGVLLAASQPEASRLHRAIDGRGFGMVVGHPVKRDFLKRAIVNRVHGAGIAITRLTA